MYSTRFIPAVLFVCLNAAVTTPSVLAQRIYNNTGPAESIYSGGSNIDSTGRINNADGRAVDRYGHFIGDFGMVPGSYVGTYRSAYRTYPAYGTYYPNGYSGLQQTAGLGYSVGVGAYSGGFSSASGQFGGGVTAGTVIAPPRTVVVQGVYPSRTIMNNSTRGGVVEYTHNGNGYIYTPGTSSQTVIQSGPSIFPTMTVVQPTQPAVVINSQPVQPTSKSFAQTYSGRASATRPVANARPFDEAADIKLVLPKEATAPLSYTLNGTTYSIKPGYSQVFADDRVWTIEFLRGGNGSLPVAYQLQAGTYSFAVDENGWDLKRFPARPAQEFPTLPPPPLAPAPIPSPDL